MRTLYVLTQLLLIVGGLNWLLVGLFSFDLVAAIFGPMTVLSRAVYILVGVSAIVQLGRLGELMADRPGPVDTRQNHP
jgi:uncharacterized protein